MVEPIKVQELAIDEQKQDCGCGCGGDGYKTAKNDCGCGCGGGECGNTQQDLVFVDAAQVVAMRHQAANQ